MKASAERILVVDDELELAQGLRYNLEIEGYEVELRGRGRDAIDRIRAGGISLVLLDVMMPEMSGLEVLELLREEGDRTPIILLTAKSQDEDIVRGLEMGADDYVTKPFGLPELLARMRAVLRRIQVDAEPMPEVFEFGPLLVDFRRYVVARDGQEHRLSRFESEILRFLLIHRDEVVTRGDLLTKVWGYTNLPTTRTVDNHIARLRKKIEIRADQPEFIQTIHGIGYRFVTGAAS